MGGTAGPEAVRSDPVQVVTAVEEVITDGPDLDIGPDLVSCDPAHTAVFVKVGTDADVWSQMLEFMDQSGSALDGTKPLVVGGCVMECGPFEAVLLVLQGNRDRIRRE